MIFFSKCKIEENYWDFLPILQKKPTKLGGKKKQKQNNNNYGHHTQKGFKKKIKGEKDTNFKIRWI
jgi:hypothetical protein